MNKEQILNKIRVFLNDPSLNVKDCINIANLKYREGSPLISDEEYDFLIKENDFSDGDQNLMEFDEYGDKVLLPYKMHSLSKLLSIEELKNWINYQFKINKIEVDKEELELVITPKYDGRAILVNRKTNVSFSRGNGEYGKRFDPEWMSNIEKSNSVGSFINNVPFVNGEIIIPKSNFKKDCFSEYANSRNAISAIFNELVPNQELLKHVHFVCYGVDFLSNLYKNYSYSDILSLLNEIVNTDKSAVIYKIHKLKDINDELINNIYQEFSNIDYDIDGLVIGINDSNIRYILGRENNGNYQFLKAFKSKNFNINNVAETKVIGIERFLNKDGELKPVLLLEPVELGGVVNSRVFCDNERFLMDYGIGIGTNVKIKKGGGIITRIESVEDIQVLESKALAKLRSLNKDTSFNKNKNLYQELKKICIKNISDNEEKLYDVKLNDSKIELVLCDTSNCEEFILQNIIFFFETIGIKNVSDSTFRLLFKNGFDTIGKIFSITFEQAENLENFKSAKAFNLIESLKNCRKNVNINRYFHASNCFYGLGYDKISLFKDYHHISHENLNPSEMISIKGAAEISVKSYIDGRRKILDWENYHSINFNMFENVYEEKTIQTKEGRLSGKIFCFTKFRDKSIEKDLINEGATVTESLTTKVDYLVIPNNNTISSKINKAKNWNIKIITKVELLETILNQNVNNQNSIF
jgi:DNA ligase (NAD+)